MEFFVDQLRLILPVLGFDFLRQSKTSMQAKSHATGQTETLDLGPLFRLTSKKHDIEAQAREVAGEFVVLEGSDAVLEWTSKSDHSYSKQHAQLLKQGKLVPGDHGNLRFAEDVAFRSPSVASAVIVGRPDNGRATWRVDGLNLSYGDWQSEQVARSASEASEGPLDDDVEG